MSQFLPTPSGCHWSHAWLEGSENLVLEIAHPTGLIEMIGHVRCVGQTGDQNQWPWALLCSFSYWGLPKPDFVKSGDAATRDAAIAAMLAAWAVEAEWRASIREMSSVERDQLPESVLRIARGQGWSELHRQALEGTAAAWKSPEV